VKNKSEQIEVYVEIPVLVNISHWPEYKGSKDEYGQLMEPNEPAGFEVESVEPCGESFEADLIEKVNELDADTFK